MEMFYFHLSCRSENCDAADYYGSDDGGEWTKNSYYAKCHFYK